MRTSRATRFVQVVAVAALLPITVGLSGGTASGGSTSFPGTGTGAVPDGGPGCEVPAATTLDITFNVVGDPAFDDIVVDMTFDPGHTWMGDLSATLIGPDTTEVSLFGDVGRTSASGSCGDSSDLAGTYTFSDGAAGDLWAEAAAATGVVIIPPGSYFPTSPGGAGVVGPAPQVPLTAPFTGMSANGTWTLRVSDNGGGDTTAVTAATLTFNSADPSGVASTVDFDGDGKDDYATLRDETPAAAPAASARSIQERMVDPTFQPGALANTRAAGSNLAWYYSASGSGAAEVHLFGEPTTDFWVPGDYDGDGDDDLAVWRGIAPNGPSGGFFHTFDPPNPAMTEVDFGVQGDNPTVAGDYDGDGTADPAVYRCPAGGGQCFFYYKGSAGGGNISSVAWGNNSINPVRPYPGDFDGDGKFDFAVFQNGQYIIKRSSDNGVEWITWGNPTDAVIAPGDYDGDGRTDFANVRVNGTNVEWWILRRDGSTQILNWGALVPGFAEFVTHGDYDGDGKTDVSIWRRDNSSNSNSFFYTLRSSDAMLETFEWGSSGDAPVPGWNAN